MRPTPPQGRARPCVGAVRSVQPWGGRLPPPVRPAPAGGCPYPL